MQIWNLYHHYKKNKKNQKHTIEECFIHYKNVKKKPKTKYRHIKLNNIEIMIINF